MKKWTVTLALHKFSATGIANRGTQIVKAMTKNKDKFFPDPRPPLSEVSATIKDLKDLIVQRKGNKVDTIAIRNKVFELKVQLTALASYVEFIANNDPGRGAEIIAAAAMNPRKQRKLAPREFKAVQGLLPGEVKLSTKSGGNNTGYIWYYRKKGAEEWIQAKVTTRAKYVIKGLKPGEEYEFSVITVKGEDYSPMANPVSLIVT